YSAPGSAGQSRDTGPARRADERGGGRDRGGAAAHRRAAGFARRGGNGRRRAGCRARGTSPSRSRQLGESARCVGRRQGGRRRSSRRRAAAGRGGRTPSRFPLSGVEPRSQYIVLEISRYRADASGAFLESGGRAVPRAGAEHRMSPRVIKRRGFLLILSSPSGAGKTT